MFDPYRKWLGIPEGQRPPTHYQLLGISADEQDREVINAAVVRHSAFIRTFQVGQYSNEATQLLNEIAAAKVCLLDPRKRAKYDAGLAERDLHSNARTQDAPVNERRQPSPVPVPPSPQRKVRPAAPRRMPAPAVRAAVAPDPLLSIPADIWSTADDQPRPLKIRVNRKPGSRWFPWAWFLAAGAGVLVLVVFVGGMRTRREVTVTGVVQIDAPTDKQSNPPPTVKASDDKVLPMSPARIEFQRPRVGSELLCVDRSLLRPGATFSISAPKEQPITFARARGPFVAVGPTVRSLANGQVIAKIVGEVGPDSVRALSADGRYYAIGDGYLLDVWSLHIDVSVSHFRTGMWGNHERARIQFLDCLDSNRIISLTHFEFALEHVIQIWDLASQEAPKPMTVGHGDAVALSDDGKYLAVGDKNGGISISILDQGQPNVSEDESVHRVIQLRESDVRTSLPQYPTNSASDRPYAIDGLCFSPDGRELVAVWEKGRQVVCFKDNRAVFEFRGPDLRSSWSGSAAYRGPVIEWEPSGRGWLLYGHYFLDRRHSRVTWVLMSDQDDQERHCFLDNDRVLVRRGNGGERQLIDVTVPWDKIDASLQAMSSENVSALIRPGESLSLDVQMLARADGTMLQYHPQDVEFLFRNRLRADGIEIVEQSSALLVVEYAERYSPPYTVANTTEQIRGSTACTVTVHLRTSGTTGDIWQGGASAIAEDDNARGTRTAIYWALGPEIRACLLPYFVPADPELLALPALLRL